MVEETVFVIKKNCVLGEVGTVLKKQLIIEYRVSAIVKVECNR